MTTRHLAFAAIWLALILALGCEATAPAPTSVPPASLVPVILG